MSRTTLCPTCGVVLNVPEGATLKRLKCPKCATRFYPENQKPPGKPGSSQPGAQPGGMSSSLLATSAHHDTDLPVATGDLRETFDPKLLLGEEEAPKRPPSRGGSTPGTGSKGGGGDIADAAALLADDQPQKRRQTTAEARTKPRRCPDCGYVVLAGMSLCNQCGLDLDTGRRHVIEEILEDTPAPIQRTGTPMGITVVGIAALLGSLGLALISFLAYFERGVAGAQLLGLVCLFGVYAAVQFLRMKSIKLLVVTLMLGGVIDLIALVALPIYRAYSTPPTLEANMGAPALVDEDLPKIRNIAHEFDTTSITWGIVLLMVDAATLVYLSTPSVRKHFERNRVGPHIPGVPVP